MMDILDLRRTLKMMYSEFLERTKFEVNSDEYHYIEDSYYDFNGNKDEFCKQWLKDRESGFWAKEYALRIMLDQKMAKQKADFAERMAKKEAEFEEQRAAWEAMDEKAQFEFDAVCGEYDSQVDRLEKKIEEIKEQLKTELKLVLKDNQEWLFRDVTMDFVQNNGRGFIKVVHKSGWVDCYLMEDIKSFQMI